MKRANKKQQSHHPLAALGSFFTGGKNNNISNSSARTEDLGSDGMSGSGSASGSSGVNNSTRNGLRTPENGGFLSSSSTVVTAALKRGKNNHVLANQNGKDDEQGNNIVMPLAAVHAAMGSATLDRQSHSSWRQHFLNHNQLHPAQSLMPLFGRPFLRNNSLGHTILPSQDQHTVPFAIDPKYDSDSDFDYRQRPPRYRTRSPYYHV